MRWIPQRLLFWMRAVCCDLWEAYTEAAREEISTARIVADCFHVARHSREAADDLRMQKLQASMHAFRKNAKDLNQEERKTLKRFFKHAALAKRAYTLRER